MWSLLLVTLPTRPNAVRLRVWRSLKALGCAALRDGAYLLPAAEAHRFEAVADAARQHGGQATLLNVTAHDEAQQRAWVALFDRGEAYAAWGGEADRFAAALPSLDAAEARRQWRAVDEALQAIGRTDYFAGAAAEQAAARLATLRRAVAAHGSKDEPTAREAGLERLDAARFRGRRWATRARPWVDRLACAWLIRRFVDPQARFVWLADTSRVPRGVLGFDYDGARFTHVGARVTFEVIAASFGLDANPALQRIGRLVHVLDVGGIPVPEAAGLEAVLAGLRTLHPDDDTLTAAAAAVFDALYAVPAP